MSKTANKFFPAVHDRAVQLVLDNERRHGSRWRVVMSIAAKIGCAPQNLPAPNMLWGCSMWHHWSELNG